MSEVYKGIVLSAGGNVCRVAPLEDIDQVSPMIGIPENIGEVSKGDTVAYTIFPDFSGVVLAKL